MSRPKGVPAFLEVWCDEHGPRDDSNICFQSSIKLAESPDLREAVINKRQLRTVLRGLKAMGFSVAD